MNNSEILNVLSERREEKSFEKDYEVVEATLGRTVEELNQEEQEAQKNASNFETVKGSCWFNELSEEEKKEWEDVVAGFPYYYDDIISIQNTLAPGESEPQPAVSVGIKNPFGHAWLRSYYIRKDGTYILADMMSAQEIIDYLQKKNME